MSCVMITNISTGHWSCPMSCIQSSVSFCTVGRARSNRTLVYTPRELTVSLEEGRQWFRSASLTKATMTRGVVES